MSTKYGGLITERHRWENESGVAWSYHALERWDERTPACSVSRMDAPVRGACNALPGGGE